MSKKGELIMENKEINDNITAREQLVSTTSENVILENLSRLREMISYNGSNIIWLYPKDLIKIYNKMLESMGRVNYITEEYVIQFEWELSKIFSIANADENKLNNLFKLICECCYKVANIPNLPTKMYGGQFSAVVFLTLCKLNGYRLNIKSYEIQSVFEAVACHTLDCEEFYLIMSKIKNRGIILSDDNY
jgi:hypothetical protein